MKNSISSLMAGALVLGAPLAVHAQSPHAFSANVGLFTDYLFRGISQTNGNPAVQGGFDYSYDTGSFADPYVGVWASNVDFGNNDENIEIDFYGGFTGEFSGGLGWDAGVLYYHYPASDELAGDPDYIEGYGGLSYTFAGTLEPTISTYFYYSPDFFGETGDAIYVTPTLDLSLPHGFGLSFGYGYQDVDDIGDYQHWNVGLSKDIGIFSLGLTYSDTFDNDDFCTGIDLCDDTLVFSVSSSF